MTTPTDEHSPAAGGIYAAMAAIIKEIGAIGKNKKCTQGASFAYRGIDDVYNALNPLLAKHKVFIIPTVLERTSVERTTRSGGLSEVVTLTVDYTFYHADGSSVVARTVGQAMDSGDKATNKAMSAAMKYVTLQAFCIPTEDLARDDPDSIQDELTPPQQQAPRANQRQQQRPPANTRQEQRPPDNQPPPQSQERPPEEHVSLEDAQWAFTTSNTVEALKAAAKRLNIRRDNPDYQAIYAAYTARYEDLTGTAPGQNGKGNAEASSKLTPAQRTAIMAYFGRRGMTSEDRRADRLAEIADFIRRDVKSVNDLTFTEASDFLSAINANREESA